MPQDVWAVQRRCRPDQALGSRLLVDLAQPMSCVQRFGEAMNHHTVGFQTIPSASIKWV